MRRKVEILAYGHSLDDSRVRRSCLRKLLEKAVVKLILESLGNIRDFVSTAGQFAAMPAIGLLLNYGVYSRRGYRTRIRCGRARIGVEIDVANQQECCRPPSFLFP